LRQSCLRICAALAGLAVPALSSAHDRSLVVTATAYNSVPSQTEGDPNRGAWGDRLEPGLRALAVSRDLLDVGLERGTRVRIDGVEGDWVVLDKMAARWHRKIDLYMGEDVPAARTWGRRTVTIRWHSTEP
jgi:3D (Asp-Asp-Asp) domain-containing protein